MTHRGREIVNNICANGVAFVGLTIVLSPDMFVMYNI